MTDTLRRLTTALADRYRVVRELGAGGMATVYLAQDLKHERDVAIKVLHPDLGAALGAERFLTEIRTTARLQHPNILALLDSGDADGLLYYVMPLVEGETLRQRLDREKQLPLDAALRIASEVADALGYAHRQGVIHRDIKPENILLHDGRPVVADFGIALAVQTAGGARMTQTGLSLGTPQYMSPEQAMGERTIDARSDLYALGAVTYEMLTGEPPFTGATVQAIVAKVLTERPGNPSAVRDTIPRHVEATVLRALAKLPADRWATATEFVHALQHPEATAALTATHPSAVQAMRGARGTVASRALPWGIAALATAAAAWGWLASGDAPGPVEPPLMAEARGVTIPEIAVFAGVRTTTISRSGTRLAWLGRDSASGGSRVFVSSLGGGSPRAVPGTESATSLIFAPDEKSVVFVRQGVSYVVATEGGAPRRLTPNSGITGLTWTADDWIVMTGTGFVSRIRATGGAPEVIVRDSTDSSTVFSAPREITEAGALLLTRTRAGAGELVTVPLGGGTVTPLGITAGRGVYARGVLVYVGGDATLQGVPFDARTLRVTGEPMSIGETPIFSGNSGFDLSETGVLLFIQASPTLGELTLVDRAGRGRPLAERTRYQFPRFSPAGTRIAVSDLMPTGGSREGDLWSIDIATGVKLRITTDGVSTRPTWSPDGESLVFSTRLPNLQMRPARVRADGTAPPSAIAETPANVYEHAFTADGRMRVWRQDTPGAGTGRDIFASPVDSPSVARAVLATRFDERGIATGPVGNWLAYVSNESGRDEVYIRHLAPGSPRWPVSRNGGVEPRWTRSGELFFRHADSVFVARVTLGAAATDAPRIAEPALLFTGPYYRLEMEATWDAAPDGQSFVLVRVPEAARPVVMLYNNWIERWKRAAAARGK